MFIENWYFRIKISLLPTYLVIIRRSLRRNFSFMKIINGGKIIMVNWYFHTKISLMYEYTYFLVFRRSLRRNPRRLSNVAPSMLSNRSVDIYSFFLSLSKS